ncbi:Profilin [Plasmodiophora brassicae]|uniref:Profilin n=1 Tax=Plasmodiophora brassicae TaxID=37360 RepID=A0A0G4IK19_PLABS|nr:hypothetical protein PBRA_004267 [Plasmodiophora brassicae]
MSGWDAWNAHVLAIKDIQGGGIFTLEGATCAQSGLTVTAPEIKAIVSGLSGAGMSSLTIGGKKFMLLRTDGDSLQARAGPAPACVFKTKTLLLVAVGKDGATAEVLSVGLGKVAEMLTQQNL